MFCVFTPATAQPSYTCLGKHFKQCKATCSSTSFDLSKIKCMLITTDVWLLEQYLQCWKVYFRCTMCMLQGLSWSPSEVRKRNPSLTRTPGDVLKAMRTGLDTAQVLQVQYSKWHPAKQWFLILHLTSSLSIWLIGYSEQEGRKADEEKRVVEMVALTWRDPVHEYLAEPLGLARDSKWERKKNPKLLVSGSTLTEMPSNLTHQSK